MAFRILCRPKNNLKKQARRENINAQYNSKSNRTEQENAESQFNLGAMYYKGQGVSKNSKKTVYWFTQSALQGYKKALDKIKVGIWYNNRPDV